MPPAECCADDPAAVCVVWQVDLAQGCDALLALEAETPRLAASDHLRAARRGGGDPGHPDARARRAAYVALRLALEQVFGAAAVRGRDMERTALGRPSLAGCDGDFSLSHAAGHTLIGIVRQGSIGVDLEVSRPIRMIGTRRTAIERAGACLVPAVPLPLSSPARFLTAWVRLEAFAKARRTSMARLLTASGALGGGAMPSESGMLDALYAATPETSECTAAAGCTVCDVRLAPGLFGALAWSGGSLRQSAPAPAIQAFPLALEALRLLGR